MKRLSNSILFLVFVITLSASAVSHAQSEVLKWKLKKGDQFDVRLDQTLGSFTKIDSRETTVENATTIKMTWNVSAVDENGEATISQAIESIELSVSNPAVPSQALKFDTSATPDEVGQFSKSSRAMLKQIKPLIGLKYDVVMLSSGEIKDVTLPKETADVIDQLPGTVRIRNLFSETGLKDVLGASAIVLPTDPLEKGGTWNEEVEVKTAFGPFVRGRKYTLVGPKNVGGAELTEIKVEPTMTAKDALETKGNSLRGKLNSFSGEGMLLMNVKGGYFKSSTLKSELKTERPYREKTIETTVTTEVGMTVTKK